ncbi:SpoIID/LytB domain-containing protein [Thermaerobacter sp. FW80]|uniref:SpoIID/LytB domain-containing protein n=1 Tax=Thermaerobacter sp. FW80 TaxID=2546351 RepID=UPI0010750871|nr:SpoIID/LytB domain-containing protein [Thermaerobacter sp. FW80]QBS37566.1 SpoIID/LytB domain-containing protein [Thermaerobacter sp. FW80]
MWAFLAATAIPVWPSGSVLTRPVRAADGRPQAAVDVLATEGLTPLPGGGWMLEARAGWLQVRLPEGIEGVTIAIPQGGPVLVTPPGYQVRVTGVQDGAVIHEVRPVGAASQEVRLEFHAVAGQTTTARIGTVTAAGDARGAGTFSIAAAGKTSTSANTGGWVRLKGGGNGHRAGMSQFGAQGLAKLGVTYREILDHYYPGTTVKKQAASDTSQVVRVGLSFDEKGGAHDLPVGRQRWTLKVDATATVVQGDTTYDLVAGTYDLTYEPGEGFYFRPLDPGGKALDVTGTSVTKVEVKAPTGKVIHLRYPTSGYRQYEGTLEFQGGGDGRMKVWNRVNLRQYLMGVVPHEMYASWGEEALKAQAVAARTYAAGQQYGENGDLVDSQADQVFHGYYDDPKYRKKIENVVVGTDGELLYYGGSLISAVYSSANGGWTASNTEAFGDGEKSPPPVPYLPGREDRFRLASGATVTPESYQQGDVSYEATYFRWQRDVAISAIEQAWPQVGELLAVQVVKRSATSNTPITIRITGSKGSVDVLGRVFRSKLALPSPLLLHDKLYLREFPDVAGALKDEINRAYHLGLVDGDRYGFFHPDEDVTRAAFTKMIVLAVEKATGEELPTGSEPFPDARPGQALYDYVVKAYNAGIVNGYPDGTFGYDKAISRMEAAAIVQRALKLPLRPEAFVDVPDGSAFAKLIGAVAAAGIMVGYGDTFGPAENLTRGQAAAVAVRGYDYCADNSCKP